MKIKHDTRPSTQRRDAMNLDISGKSIIIAPSYLHQTIREKLLKKQKGILNVQIQSLSTYLLESYTDDTTYEYYVTLKRLQSHLTYQKNSVSSLSFIDELKTLITHMKEYQIPTSRLPQSNAVEKELKMIIETLYPITLPIDSMQENLTLKMPQFKELLFFAGYHTIYERNIYRFMENNGAKKITIKTGLVHKEFFYALNKRSEIESLAQYIIEHHIPAKEIKISLLDQSYLPYLKMIFEHYQIPLQVQDEQEVSFIQSKFIAMLTYYMNPCNENAISLLASQFFNIPFMKEVIDYLALYNLDLHDDFHIVEKVHIANDVIDEREVNRLLTLEKKAQAVQEQIMPMLEKIEACADIIDVLCCIDELLIQSHHFTSKEERKAILQIREEIKKCDRYLNKREDLSFFINILMNLRVKKENSIIGCIVSDFRHHLPFKKYHFVLGATQDNYPAMQTFSGIFEESYYDALGYLSLEERYALHMECFTEYLSTSEHLICFYPISTFDGKANEAALEIEQFMHPIKASKYPLKEHYIAYQRKYQIHAETAQQLYLKDNTLYGSISSFERYANCPYAYFLHYGLRLEEPIDYRFNNAKAGTLTHYIMEVLSTKYKKGYVDVQKEEIHAILKQKVNEIIALYPNRKQQLEQMEIRLLASMIKNLEVLKDYEQHSSLSPTYSEYAFHHDLVLANDCHLHLKGFIDRIDTNQDFFCIIDYKSSPKVLQEEQVFAGLQLQLMTYLTIMEEKLKLRPLGAFYYSFANPNINMEYAKLKKRPLQFDINNEEKGFQALLKEKKLAGWLTSEYIEVMDNSGSHIKGVRNSKASGINSSTIYQSETLSTYIKQIYTLLAKQILSGNIDCQSASGACTYCPYASICANANQNIAKKEMIEVEDTLYQKGGRKHA
ncbi:MAG: hypothetical protein EOM50_03615 [Erysipelotrichia bacterium]|nr:hypothetical protein [Erysipelotrichia bacterium]NCC54470.1 hypothetical protein [Erysipelotrichia bacterium]